MLDLAVTFRHARIPEESTALADLWRRAVEATHHFLTRKDIEGFYLRLREEFRTAFDVVVADVDGAPAGFLGSDGHRIEMLFVDPAHHGRGIGSALIDHVMRDHDEIEVDVNEQNPGAVAFYRARGFQQIGRSATDDDGNPFPILHMRRTAAT